MAEKRLVVEERTALADTTRPRHRGNAGA